MTNREQEQFEEWQIEQELSTCGWHRKDDDRYGCLRCDTSHHDPNYRPEMCVRRAP